MADDQPEQLGTQHVLNAEKLAQMIEQIDMSQNLQCNWCTDESFFESVDELKLHWQTTCIGMLMKCSKCGDSFTRQNASSHQCSSQHEEEVASLNHGEEKLIAMEDDAEVIRTIQESSN